MLTTISTLLPMHPVVAIVTAAIFISILYYITKYRNVPPGPVGLPYLGLLPFLKEDNSATQMEELTKKYGRLFSFTVTGKLYVNLGTVKLIREAHITKSECFNRITDFSLLSYAFAEGVAFVNGENWKTQRKFFTQAFREYGMTVLKDSVAGPVYDEIRSNVDDLRQSAGKTLNIVEILTERCSSIIRRMLFGDDGISRKELMDLVTAYGIVAKSMTCTKMLICGNVAKYLIMPLYTDCRNAFHSHNEMVEITKKIVKRHESKFDENNVNDVIDGFIKERIERRKRNDPSAEYFSDAALISSIIEFVGDGILTVSFFISAFLTYLVKYPIEQEKLYQEIVDVVGTNRLPTMDDKGNLPYTNAYIHEVIRHPSSFPIFPSLECIKETTIQGYRIPKGSVTLYNMWSIHHDPEAYENPNEFNPSRFITTHEKQREELPAFFGIGKRSCAGEAFTMMQVFLFLTSIVQNFEVSLPQDHLPEENTAELFDSESIKLVLTPRVHK